MSDTQPQQQNTRLPFIRPADVSREGTKIKIGDSIRPFKSQYGLQLVVTVHVGERAYDWGIKINGAKHIAIENKFGRNLLRWPGKEITVYRDEFMDRNNNMKDHIKVEGERAAD